LNTSDGEDCRIFFSLAKIEMVRSIATEK